MSRYRIVLLGHEEKSIQRTLDEIPDDNRLISAFVVGGVNVLAVIDRGVEMLTELRTGPVVVKNQEEWNERVLGPGTSLAQTLSDVSPKPIKKSK